MAPDLIHLEGTMLRPSAMSPMKADSPQPTEHTAPPNNAESVEATAEAHDTPNLDKRGSTYMRPGQVRHTPLGRQPRPRQNQAQTGSQPRMEHREGKKSIRANIKIALLNMRGRWHNGVDKWHHINQIIREKKIGIMEIQETHLSKEEESKINETFGRRITVIWSIEPENTNAKGVAVILNVYSTNSKEATSEELVPGRALLIQISWMKNAKLSVLAIYTPNEPTQNQVFWEEIHSKLIGKPTPDVVLGNFNIVEGAC
ncbi:uncharacterized protein F5891DRAFT_1192835 [Suillus fuscotomentosus]|uniref:Endonuclease/exonuclease/phosphatase domain-containing protein n=1 Tax=Suillus fuscotomentosus TaxID=1912939 RepID=A0AAD4HHI7_9AGAM|nr:uncharacterized protein F5891DRAFT_1192835 [Suillus fuscotomentosus]KAG1896712.1 hypothetical protein F5891DRAFT_1192835 [Suillus fuscotomentosus]